MNNNSQLRLQSEERSTEQIDARSYATKKVTKKGPSAPTPTPHLYNTKLTTVARNLKRNYLEETNPRIKNTRIFAFDFETVIIEDLHVPIVATAHSNGFKYVTDCINDTSSAGVSKMMDKFFRETIFAKDVPTNTTLDEPITSSAGASTNKRVKTISVTAYAHNLGNFDGYIIYTHLTRFVKSLSGGKIDILIDADSKIIMITAEGYLHNKKFLVRFVDSLRIFNVSLKKLGQVFNNTEDQKGEYNTENYTNLEQLRSNDKLREELLNYAYQDSRVLYKAIASARKIYLDNFGYDILASVSITGIALGVYRSKYISKPNNAKIIALPKFADGFVRQGYYGGCTQVFRSYGQNLHYYDVNSLYPSVILNKMPLEPLNPINTVNIDNTALENFFGFIEAKVTCPQSIKVPLLPYRILQEDGVVETLAYPYGTWTGVYFSEELKKAQSLGYTIECLNGMEFNSGYPFNKYVTDIYKIKQTATTAGDRTIAKNLLNYLYGYFGRKTQNLHVFTVKKEDLGSLDYTYVLEKIIDHGDNENFTITTYGDKRRKIPNFNIAEKTLDIKNNSTNINNAAISAAITAYGRIKIHDFKTIPGNQPYYTDTDSIILANPLNPKYISDDTLGIIKDELNGQTMIEGFFFGPKKYGYTLKETDGSITTRSVWAGFDRNSITYDELKGLITGATYNREHTNDFAKKRDTFHITRTKVNKILKSPILPVNPDFTYNNSPTITQPSKIKKIATKTFLNLARRIVKIIEKKLTNLDPFVKQIKKTDKNPLTQL